MGSDWDFRPARHIFYGRDDNIVRVPPMYPQSPEVRRDRPAPQSSHISDNTIPSYDNLNILIFIFMQITENL